MINKITFRNYKLFKNTEVFELKPITILIGKNNSGKSAIAKLPTLVSGSLSKSFEEPLLWDNGGIELGTELRDLIYEKSASGELEFTIENEENSIEIKLTLLKDDNGNFYSKVIYWKYNNDIELKFDFAIKKYHELKRDIFVECSFLGFLLNSIDESSGIVIPIYDDFNFKFDYIGAYRAITDNKGYEKPKEKNIEKVGIDGIGAYSFLINDYLNNNKDILTEVSNWYQENFDGWGISLDNEIRRNIFYFDLERKTPRRSSISLKFVGQGMGQILPLVTRAFMKENEPMLTIIEEPELHLHPSAHGDLAQLFAKSLENPNKSYLIETHSENFILRLRRLIAESKYTFFTENDLKIYYIDYNSVENTSTLRSIKVDRMGDVDDWPENIFNESFDEVFAIRKAQKEKRNVS